MVMRGKSQTDGGVRRVGRQESSGGGMTVSHESPGQPSFVNLSVGTYEVVLRRVICSLNLKKLCSSTSNNI